MQPPKESFEELRQRLRQGRGLSDTGDDPVYYVVFHPKYILEVKRLMKEWKAKLELDGWKAETLSMADAVHGLFRDYIDRDDWLEDDANRQFDPESFETLKESQKSVLESEGALKNLIEEKLQSLAGQKNTVLFLTDVEALHPYLRVGVMEQQLLGKVTVPMVVLYPGTREGQTSLRFLGFYPPDGNYRSLHIGG
ncbi:MAG: DUF1788 domain-containing protein [Verrucomicrobiales bacterium]|nr:DUF1788 domain-containing protein [Verrucomicrobiales bacterium]